MEGVENSSTTGRASGRPKGSKGRKSQSAKENEKDETSTTEEKSATGGAKGRPKGSKGKKSQSAKENDNDETSTTEKQSSQRPKKKKGPKKPPWLEFSQTGHATSLAELAGPDNKPPLVPTEPRPAGQPESTAMSPLSSGFHSQGMVPVYPREDWKAIDPTGEMSPMRPGVSTVRFVDTGKGTQRCRGQESCFSTVQLLQQRHMSQGLDDINYNFLIADDGSVYIGRGYEWDCDRAEDMNHLKGDCYDIAFIGDFRDDEVPGPMLASGYNMIAHGHDKKHILRDVRTIKTMDLKDQGIMDKALKAYINKSYNDNTQK